MKKQIIALALGLMTIGAFAQKKELKEAEKALKKGSIAAAINALNSVDAMEATMEPKYKAKYYFLKGQAYSKNNLEVAAEAFNKLFKYEEEIGKQKYTKEAKPMLQKLIQSVSKKSIDQYNAKDYTNATKNFLLTYKLSPTDTTQLYNAAVSASLAEDFESSLKHYKTLQELGYTGVQTIYYAVNKASGAKENLGTLKNQKAYVKLGSHNNPTIETTKSKKPDIVKNIGFILIRMGKTDEAIVAIKKARESNPKDVNLILNEADLYLKLKDMKKFGALMEEAVKLDPNNHILFFNLGVVNQNQNNIDEAIKFYKRAIEIKPDYADAYNNLGVALLSSDQKILDEMNENIANEKKYNELNKKRKEILKKALPYFEKANELKESEETKKQIKQLKSILNAN